MAYESVAITAGAGTNVAVDTVAGQQIQVIKLDGGGDGASVPIVAGQQAMVASVPVVIASNQTAVPIADGGNTITVDGTVAVTNAGITTIAGAVAGTEMQVDVLTLPAITGTVTVQDGGNTITVDGTVAVTNADMSTVAGAVSGGHMQVDVLSGAGATAVTVDVTLSMTAEAHHAGDVLAATQEVAGVARANGTGGELVSMVVRDADDQTAAATTFYFLDANTALGTEGSEPDIDDTEVQDICGMVTVPAAAWVDVGASKVAVMPNIGLLMFPAAGSTSLWLAVTTAGTPTPSTSGMTVTLQFIRY